MPLPPEDINWDYANAVNVLAEVSFAAQIDSYEVYVLGENIIENAEALTATTTPATMIEVAEILTKDTAPVTAVLEAEMITRRAAPPETIIEDAEAITKYAAEILPQRMVRLAELFLRQTNPNYND